MNDLCLYVMTISQHNFEQMNKAIEGSFQYESNILSSKQIKENNVCRETKYKESQQEAFHRTAKL